MYFEVTSKTPIRRILFALVLPVMAVGIISCATVERRVQVPVLKDMRVHVRPVRVLVGTQTRSNPLYLSSRGRAKIYSGDAKTILATIPLNRTPVSLNRRKGIVVGQASWGRSDGIAAVIVVPEKGDSIFVGNTNYPGCVALVKRGESVLAINYVAMEDYVAGVVSCEMPRRFCRAALEAQAVAARTYALWTMSKTRLLLYDLRNTEASQVYRGLTGTSSFGRNAARRTAGVVMVYDWKFLPAFYSSTCGGHTAPSSQLANAPRIAPLSGVECGYCQASPRYRWAITVPLGEVEQALAQAGYVSGKLKDIKVTSTVVGGWVDTVEVVGSDGNRRISGNVFRRVIGTGKFYSANFSIRKVGDQFVIRGRGFGHGVGMCQYGADGMGRRGRNFVEILSHYYPGVKVIKIY